MDGFENQLGERISRQVVIWVFEERESKLMPRWKLDMIHPPMQRVWLCRGQDHKFISGCMRSLSAHGGVLQRGYLVSSGVFESGVWREAGILDLGAIATHMVIDSWE